MPHTAAGLSGKDLETATTVPSGALSLNLKLVSSSMNSSKIPVMRILLNSGRRVTPGRSRRVRGAALRPGGLFRQMDHLTHSVCGARHTV
ncbi:hypothetical protein GCM10017710_21740 [Arthrobacter ramosus]